jgi:hypothetical protein
LHVHALSTSRFPAVTGTIRDRRRRTLQGVSNLLV